MLNKALIDEFLSCRRLAIVGVSGDSNHFSRAVFQAFRDRGYEAIPVNPKVSEIAGTPCYASVSAIEPPVEAALVMTPPSATAGVVQDCAKSHVSRIWMHRGGGGPGSVDPEAVQWCAVHDIRLIAGECPFMFLSNTPWYHRLHGWIRSWTRA
jgi:predicted CoA-binding protein